MKKIIAIISTSIIIFSCGSSATSIYSKHEAEIIPSLNTISTKEIGESLVSKMDLYIYDAINVIDDYKMPKYLYDGGIKKGIYLLKSKYKEYKLYSNGSGLGVAISDNGITKAYTIPSAGRINLVNIKETINFKETTYQDIDKPNFKQEFIYSGKSGNILKFSYREFNNDLARPAFTQDLQYDLNESKTIGFKGLRIEVSKATNTNIEYKVVNYFTS